MNPNTWCPEDGQLLQMLRTQAAIDSHVFARNNTLSLAQLQELESGIGNYFYSDLIKRSAGIKLLKKLGYIMPLPLPQEATTPVESLVPSPIQAHAPSPLQTSVALIATERTPPPTSKTRPSSPMIWIGGLLVMGLVGLLSFQGQASAPAQSITFGTNQSANTATGPASALQAAEPPPVMLTVSEPETPPNKITLAPTVSSANPVPDRAQQATVTCEDKHRNNSKSHTSSNPLKPGNYIYIEARADSELCVLDSENKLSVLSLSAGMTQKVDGLAPFLLHTSNWQGLQVFFQGRLVHTDHGDSAHLVLKSLPL